LVDLSSWSLLQVNDVVDNGLKEELKALTWKFQLWFHAITGAVSSLNQTLGVHAYQPTPPFVETGTLTGGGKNQALCSLGPPGISDSYGFGLEEEM
jgi:hypothetical protein